MNDQTYNGWTNYETWVWKLWIDNDVGLYEYWQDQIYDVKNNAEIKFDFETIEDAQIRILAERLEYVADEMAEQWMPEQSGPFTDLLNSAFGEINWREIAENMLS